MLRTIAAAVLLAASSGGQSGTAVVEPVGRGTPGTPGVPVLQLGGLPVPGQLTPDLRITGGLPGAAAQVLFGPSLAATSLPAYGATLYPAPPIGRLVTALDAQGHSAPLLSGPVPAPAALLGLEIVAQGVVSDAAAQGGFAFTQGLRVVFGAGWTAAPLYAHAAVPVGGDAIDLASGDVDGDGVPDLASVHVDGSVSLCLGLGHRYYAPPETLEAPPDLFGAATVDLVDVDGDGALDLATLGWNLLDLEPRLDVRLGDGAGGFAAPAATVVADCSTGVKAIRDRAWADLDGDGRLELCLAIQSCEAVLVVPGAGGPATSVPLPFAPGHVFADDVDGDGVHDLVALTGSFDDQGATLLGDGALGFGAAQAFSTGGNDPRDAALADLDGDGLPELVVAHEPTPPSPKDVVVLSNPGGAFGPPMDGGAPLWVARGLAVREVTGDGLPDLVYLDAEKVSWPVDGGQALLQGCLLSVAPGLGDGSFGPVAAQPSPPNRTGLLLADDGPMLWTTTVSSPSTGPVAAMPATLGDPVGIVDPKLGSITRLADLDGDGHVDLVSLKFAGEGGQLLVGLGVGDGSFGNLQSFTTGAATGGFDVEDLDGDGDLDAAVADGAGHQVALVSGDGHGAFSTPTFLPAALGAGDVFVADVDGDGVLDLVTFSSVLRQYSVLLGTGGGGFLPGPSTDLVSTPGTTDDAALADVTGDGRPDLVVARASHTAVWIWAGTGTAVFAPPVEVAWPFVPDWVDVHDVDADGALDLVAGAHLPGLIALRRGTGDGGFLAATSPPVQAFGRRVDVADVNADGAPDMLVVPGVQGIAVLLGLGGGGFAAPQEFGWGVLPAVGDVDGDGRPDVVLKGGPVLLDRGYENATTGVLP